jgi:DHA3 family multidrug efflux protein-like MFS transporter
MKTFYQVLINSTIVSIINNFVWFAVVFWAYLETQSVLSTSIIMGAFLVAAALSSFWFGSIVDHHRKKYAMAASSIITLVMFIAAYLFYLALDHSAFASITSYAFWGFILILLLGVVVGNIRSIAMPTVITILVVEDQRDKANGLSGTAFGISFAITSVISGIMLANFGMGGVLLTSIILSVISLIHLIFLSIPEEKIAHTHDKPKSLDLKGTIKVINSVPGLFALIIFHTFNNFLGGVFMALMDAYGLTLVKVETWGFIWGFLSTAFIASGIIISKKGLGSNPLKTLFIANICMWIIAIFFTVQPWIILLTIGMFFYLGLVPFAEASEQTILQKVVPLERQGRVFGFAQSVESSASPLTAFVIGPIAQFIFIPYMTTGAGVDLIGSWYGVGPGRGMALLFSIAGIIGLIVTLIAMKSNAYNVLSARYRKSP